MAADLGRGRELYNTGRFEDAARELSTVVRDNDGDADAHRLLGLALLEQGKTDEAARHIERAHELNAGGESRAAMARVAAARKDWDKTEQMLGEATGDEADYARGLLHLNRDRFEEAANALESFIEKRPDHAYAHYYAGLAYNGLRRPDRMMTHFEMFLKMKPDAPEARKVRAVVRTGR
jgi:tetratricopeptide (TPR) repeat protein